MFREVAVTHGITGVDYSEPSGHFVQANGLRFHYLDWGGTGYPVLFLHGADQSAVTWDLVAIQLRKDFHCIALDMRNHGQSDHPPLIGTFFDSETLAKDVQEVVRGIGLKDYCLVGMSLGGMVSLAFAATKPEGLKALAVVDALPSPGPARAQPGAPPLPPPAAQVRGQAEFDSLEQAIDLAAKQNPGRPRVHLEFSLANSLMQREDGKWVWKKPRLASRRVPPTPEEMEFYRKKREALWGEMGKIACPTLLVLGGRSPATTPEGGKRLAAVIPDCRVVIIPDAGHTVQGDQPKALAGELRAFCSSTLRR